MIFSKSQPEQKASSLPAYRQVQHRLLGICILLAPLTLTVYLLSWININVRGTSIDYSQSIAAISDLVNQIHMTFGIVASIFLLPGFLGMALLGMKRAPWLATISAIFALVG